MNSIEHGAFAHYLGQNVSGFGSPYEWLGLLVVLGDVAEMDRDEKKERLMNRSVVDEHIASFSQMVRDHMMAMPDRLAPAVAAVTDAGTARKVLMHDVETGLRKLSKTIASAGF